MNIRKSFFAELPFFISVPALLWQFLFLYVPLLFVLLLSFTYDGKTFGFTFAHYTPFFSSTYFYMIIRSLLLALGNGLVSLCIAYPVAYYLALHIKQYKNLFLFFMVLPFWTNLLVQVYAWFFVLEPYGIINSLLLWLGIISQPLELLNTTVAVFLGMVYCYVPFMVVPLYSILESLDIRLLEASADLGADPWKTFRNITLPLSLPGIQTGFFLVFIPSFGEFVIPALLGGGRTMYVGTLISYYFLITRNVFSGTAFTALSSLLLMVVAIALYYISVRMIIRFAGGEL